MEKHIVIFRKPNIAQIIFTFFVIIVMSLFDHELKPNVPPY